MLLSVACRLKTFISKIESELFLANSNESKHIPTEHTKKLLSDLKWFIYNLNLWKMRGKKALKVVLLNGGVEKYYNKYNSYTLRQ